MKSLWSRTYFDQTVLLAQLKETTIEQSSAEITELKKLDKIKSNL